MGEILTKFQYRLIRNPVIGPPLRYLVRQLSEWQFHDSDSYWNKRYARGGNSGPGSYNKLAEQKAEVINRFVAEQQVNSVIEFGCGDGNQLLLAKYPHYTGYDISPAALEHCRELFKEDRSKQFYQMNEYDGTSAGLTLSLDVIFHLTEDDVYDAYMRRLFSASSHFVGIYSSNQDDQSDVFVAHVKHRKFTAWIDAHMPEWKLMQMIANRYPYQGDPKTGSFADFYFYRKM